MKAAYLRYAIQRCCCCIKKLNCYKVILEFHIHRQPDLCSFAWVRLFFFCAKKASVNHISVKDRGLLQLGFNWVWGDGIRIDPFAKCLHSQSNKNPSLASFNNIKKHPSSHGNPQKEGCRTHLLAIVLFSTPPQALLSVEL